ncbi:MAG: ribose-5-phosphate isomerase [delta proteobacterium ML8_D]|jgi:ribose 5-phosphate isomerase B|nr:MAG: ribose-5-phosphate isomerase [delta proteobacterium ML8_D]
MKIAIGSDHGGFELKEEIRGLLAELGHQVLDVGCYSPDSVDYPIQGRKVAESVTSGQCERGVLICGTGIGMSIVANRISGIRATLCHDLFTARMGREHNDSNILCMGGRVVETGLAKEMVKVWLMTSFKGGRHSRRINMIDLAEQKNDSFETH